MRRLFIAISALLLASGARGGSADPPPGDWAFREAHGQCLLERGVEGFGRVRFAGAPGGALRLEVLGHRGVFADGAVTVFRVAPPWHPEHPRREVLGAAEHRSGAGLLLEEPLATRVLMALYRGFEAHLRHDAWYGGDAGVRIANVHLRPRYHTFVRCLRGPAAEGWTALERTRVEYASGAASLSSEARARLRRIAEYVREDPKVTRIYVDGHTDAAGSSRGNLRLSKRRATTVAGFLEEQGVAEERLVVRYHGGAYPVAGNDDPRGRARNRRTTVRLEREWREVADAG